jgi:fatty acid desaturase
MSCRVGEIAACVTRQRQHQGPSSLSGLSASKLKGVLAGRLMRIVIWILIRSYESRTKDLEISPTNQRAKELAIWRRLLSSLVGCKSSAAFLALGFILGVSAL